MNGFGNTDKRRFSMNNGRLIVCWRISMLEWERIRLYDEDFGEIY